MSLTADAVTPFCRRVVWAFAVWIVVAGLGLGQVAAETPGNVTMQVTPAAGRAMVAQALSRGNADLAIRIARQLLAANPADIEAQVLLTAALSRAGQSQAAAAAGKHAFRATKSRPLKFQAAFLTAEALAGQNQPWAAKWWLRRADSYRSTPTDITLLRRGFASLDQRTPLKFTLTLGVGPSNNVNGGSLHDTYDYYGIPIPIEQALSGTTGVIGGQLSYRLLTRETSSVTAFVKLRHREVWLSDQALKLAPWAKSSDYSSDAVEIGFSGQWRASKTMGLNYSAQFGRQWYNSGQHNETQRLQFGLAKLISGDRVLRFDLTTDAVQSPSAPRTNSQRWAAEASMAVPMGKGRLTGLFGLARLDAEAPGLPYRSVSLGVEADPARFVQGIDFGFFAEVEAKEYWKAKTEHPDLVLEAGATASLSNMSLLGFRPTATLSATRSISDLVVRDSMNIGLTVGIRSSF